MCDIAVVGVAPCQCFTPGGNQTTSPGRISCTEPPSRCTQPRPDVTMSVCPNGWVCHAVRAPGSKVTSAAAARADSLAANSGSIRVVPLNQSAGPLADGCEPLRVISISMVESLFEFDGPDCDRRIAGSVATATVAVFTNVRRWRGVDGF